MRKNVQQCLQNCQKKNRNRGAASGLFKKPKLLPNLYQK